MPALTRKKKIAAVLSHVLLLRRRRRRNRRGKLWSKLLLLRRQRQGASASFCHELVEEDSSSFANFSRLYPEQFHQLEELVAPKHMTFDVTWLNATLLLAKIPYNDQSDRRSNLNPKSLILMNGRWYLFTCKIVKVTKCFWPQCRWQWSHITAKSGSPWQKRWK